MKVYHHTAKCEDGKIYDFYCEKFPDGRYKHDTMERREVTDRDYIKWYNNNYCEKR